MFNIKEVVSAMAMNRWVVPEELLNSTVLVGALVEIIEDFKRSEYPEKLSDDELKTVQYVSDLMRVYRKCYRLIEALRIRSLNEARLARFIIKILRSKEFVEPPRLVSPDNSEVIVLIDKERAVPVSENISYIGQGVATGCHEFLIESHRKTQLSQEPRREIVFPVDLHNHDGWHAIAVKITEYKYGTCTVTLCNAGLLCFPSLMGQEDAGCAIIERAIEKPADLKKVVQSFCRTINVSNWGNKCELLWKRVTPYVREVLCAAETETQKAGNCLVITPLLAIRDTMGSCLYEKFSKYLFGMTSFNLFNQKDYLCSLLKEIQENDISKSSELEELWVMYKQLKEAEYLLGKSDIRILETELNKVLDVIREGFETVPRKVFAEDAEKQASDTNNEAHKCFLEENMKGVFGVMAASVRKCHIIPR